MRIKEIFPFVLLVLFFACQERTEKKSITNDSTYVIPEMKVKPFEEGLTLFMEPVFIKLKSNTMKIFCPLLILFRKRSLRMEIIGEIKKYHRKTLQFLD